MDYPTHIEVGFDNGISETSVMEFYIDNFFLGVDSISPYKYYLNAGKWADNLTHQIIVIGKNKQGVAIDTVSQNIIILNTAITGPEPIMPKENVELKDLKDLFIEWTYVEGAKQFLYEVSENSDFSTLIYSDVVTKRRVEVALLPYGNFFWRVRFLGNRNRWEEWNQPTKFSYLVYNGDFETGDFKGWRLDAPQKNSIQLVNSDDKLNFGNYIAKLKLEAGDNINDGHRVELVKKDDGVYGKVRKYSWDFMIDEDYIDDDRIQIITQFHNQPDFYNGEDYSTYPSLPPPISITYSYGIGKVVVNSIGMKEVEIGRFDIIKGRWFHVYFEIKWSLDSDGYVLCIIDNSPLSTNDNSPADKFYIPTVYNRVGNYIKIGLYRHNEITTTNTVYVDNFSIN